MQTLLFLRTYVDPMEVENVLRRDIKPKKGC